MAVAKDGKRVARDGSEWWWEPCQTSPQKELVGQGSTYHELCRLMTEDRYMSKDLHAAVLAIQSEIGTLQKNAINPHFKSKYISLDSLVEHVQPLLTKHGLVWICKPAHSEGTPTLVYSLLHVESGAVVEGEMPLLLEKQNAQGLGSAITYARRHALCAVLNIVADVDDDGNKAAPAKKPAAEKPKDFASQIRATGMKGNDIKAYLMAEEGFDNEYFQSRNLIDILNAGLDGDKQEKLLAWATGSSDPVHTALEGRRANG